MALSRQQVSYAKWLVALLALYPFTRLVLYYFTDRLGANPIEFITRSTGTWTFVGLLITLSITPLRKWLKAPWLLQLRRHWGLWTFFYACLHFTTYIWLDQFFDLGDIIKDVIKRPFITVGFAAFILLIPLAVTSNNRVIRSMGAKRWQLLHYVIYIIGVLAALHYWWLVKRDLTQPIYFSSVLAVLLLLRVWWRFEAKFKQ
jgi:methionine sulfoxide reductase heme-binding subunit